MQLPPYLNLFLDVEQGYAQEKMRKRRQGGKVGKYKKLETMEKSRK